MRLIDADTLHIAIIEKGQANERGKYIVGDIWELTGAEIGEVIDSQPTINPEPHWIPVTERLPEPRIDVWCNSDLGQMVGYYDETIETWFGRDYLELLVNAWMPLPEPFKGVIT